MSATRFTAVHFCDVAPPLINGVVRAVSDLMQAQRQLGSHAVAIAPASRGDIPGWDANRTMFGLPAFGLPTSAGYRCAVRGPRLAEIRDEFSGGAPVMHAHSLFRAAAFARRCARDAGAPFVITYHTRLQYYAHYAGLAARAFRGIFPAFAAHVLNGSDAVIVPSETVAAELRAAGARAPFFVIPQGIDTAAFHRRRPGFSAGRIAMRERLRIAPHVRLLLSVVRLAREKNISALIAAAADLPDDAMLIVCGDGPDRKILERNAQAAAAARIRFIGAIEPAAMPDIYAAADAFVFPSISETQGLVLWEAFAAGLPVVVADCPVSREIAAGAGIRYMQPDCSDFAAALTAVAADGSSAELQAARATRIAEIDRRVAARRVIDVYAALHQNKRPNI